MPLSETASRPWPTASITSTMVSIIAATTATGGRCAVVRGDDTTASTAVAAISVTIACGTQRSRRVGAREEVDVFAARTERLAHLVECSPVSFGLKTAWKMTKDATTPGSSPRCAML